MSIINRYDNKHPFIKYINLEYWTNGDSINFYQGDNHTNSFYRNDPNMLGKKSCVIFTMTGKQFQLENQCHNDGRNLNLKVYVNGNYIDTINAPQHFTGRAVYYISPVFSESINQVTIEGTIEKNTFILHDVINVIDGELIPNYMVKVPENLREVQILSKEYKEDNVIRKDYIGNLEDCILSNVEILKTSQPVNNSKVQTIKIKTISDDKFILD